MAGPGDFKSYPSSLRALAPFGPYRAILDGWRDGDTFVALVDFGLEEHGFRAFRLYGVDAGELDSPNPAEQERAGEALTAVWAIAPAGTPLVLYTALAKDAPRSFDRFVVRVVMGGGFELNRALLDLGTHRPDRRGVRIPQLEALGLDTPSVATMPRISAEDAAALDMGTISTAEVRRVRFDL